MALRLRRSGKQWLQTLKGGGSVEGGLHRRNELETAVSDPELDFSLLQVPEWKDILPRKLRKKLQPVFVTDFSRSSRILSWQGAEIELCMDQGEISTEHLHTPICELELELKSGESRQLFELALAILEVVPFNLEAVSKAEQGFRLLSGYIEQPVKAQALVLDKHEHLSGLMQTLIWSVLLHFQSNVPGAKGGDHAEYIHQMRVALRQLRVFLRMAESVCADEQLGMFRKEIATLALTLGKIREWDVFIAETVQPMSARMPDDIGMQALLAASEQQRDLGYRALNNDTQARALQRIMLRLAIWMNGAYWKKFESVELRARDFVASYLSELSHKFERAGENLSTFDAGQLHAMRIQAKKLRYCAEFFASLYGKHKARKYLNVLSRVQEILGQINDVTVAQRLLHELSLKQEMLEHQETIALSKGWVAHDQSDQLLMLGPGLGAQ